MNSENSKASERHRFRLDLTDKLDLKDPKKNMALANLLHLEKRQIRIQQQ